MYCYYIESLITNEKIPIFGYTLKNAFERAKLNAEDWELIDYEYVD